MIRFDRTAGPLTLTVLAAIVLLAVVAIAASVGGSATPSDGAQPMLDEHDEDRYSVVQAGECHEIEPIGDGTRTVSQFYDYRSPFTQPDGWEYSSHGTTHLQEDDTSIMFLHEGSDGLSLVIVHDQYDGSSDGGAATFQIDGLPEEGDWAVEDDNYSGYVDGEYIEADAEWDHGDDWSRITWVWAAERTDGGAFNGGLDDAFSIQIDPAFNDLADFREGPGEISEWQVLSAPEDNPERTSLLLNQPVEIRSGGCVTVSDLDVDDTVTQGGTVDVSVTVTNDGSTNETLTVPISIDGEVVDEREVTLEPGESTTVTSAVEFDDEGEATVSAGDTTRDVTVEAAGTMEQLPGFGIAVAVAAISAALLLRRYRR